MRKGHQGRRTVLRRERVFLPANHVHARFVLVVHGDVTTAVSNLPLIPWRGGRENILHSPLMLSSLMSRIRQPRRALLCPLQYYDHTATATRLFTIIYTYSNVIATTATMTTKVPHHRLHYRRPPVLSLTHTLSLSLYFSHGRCLSRADIRHGNIFDTVHVSDGVSRLENFVRTRTHK